MNLGSPGAQMATEMGAEKTASTRYENPSA